MGFNEGTGVMVERQVQGALRQADVRALAQELAEALAAGDAALDLSGVTQMDAGALQVLISASSLADRTGRRLHLYMPDGCAARVLADALALPAIGVPMPAPMPEPVPAPADVAPLNDAGQTP